MTILNLGHNSANPPLGHHWLRVKKCRKLTQDSIQIFFDVPDHLASLFQFKPGQHVDIALNKGNHLLKRSYSICSGPDELLSIAVKHIHGGLVSGFLNTSVQEGDYLAVSTPHGSFTLREGQGHITLFAAGSGITPLISMIKFALVKPIGVTLIYGNQTMASTMFIQDISDFNTVRTIGLLSRENKENYINGRIDHTTLPMITALDASILSSDGFYICGPSEMITSVRNYLINAGVPERIIHHEFFKAPPDTKNVTTSEPEKIEFEEYHLQVLLEGEKYSIEVKSTNSTLLETALSHGLDAPFSCKTGVCGSCRAKIIKGSVVMKANYALTPEELENRYILACQSISSCKELSISFDA